MNKEKHEKFIETTNTGLSNLKKKLLDDKDVEMKNSKKLMDKLSDLLLFKRQLSGEIKRKKSEENKLKDYRKINEENDVIIELVKKRLSEIIVLENNKEKKNDDNINIEELTCFVCMNPYNDKDHQKMNTKCCKKSFCSSCFQNMLKLNQSCPNCKDKMHETSVIMDEEFAKKYHKLMQIYNIEKDESTKVLDDYLKNPNTVKSPPERPFLFDGIPFMGGRLIPVRRVSFIPSIRRINPQTNPPRHNTGISIVSTSPNDTTTTRTISNANIFPDIPNIISLSENIIRNFVNNGQQETRGIVNDIYRIKKRKRDSSTTREEEDDLEVSEVPETSRDQQQQTILPTPQRRRRNRRKRIISNSTNTKEASTSSSLQEPPKKKRKKSDESDIFDKLYIYNVDSPKPFCCKNCNRKYKLEKNVIEHIRSVHSNEIYK